MNSKEKKEFLLRKYIKEVEQLPFQSSDGHKLVVKDTYICPLCLKSFNIALLGEEENSLITLEHIPPENLGGKPIILTCKKCNSVCGHDLDVYLRNEMEHRERNYFDAPKGHFVKLSHEGIDVNAIIKKDEDDIININIKKSLNPPDIVDRFVESTNASADDLHINGKVKLGSHRRKVEVVDVAILKSAYLYAFYRLGYKYILSTNLQAIREQILNPDKEILPPHYLLLNENKIPNQVLDDIYAATLDGERILVVILTLKLPSSGYRHRFATILPMPHKKDLELYKRLMNIHTTKGTVEFQFLGNARIE